MPECIWCHMPIYVEQARYGKETRLYRLDGTMEVGPMHNDCWTDSRVGIVSCGQCGGRVQATMRMTFELASPDTWDDYIYKSGCPEHGNPEDALSFMLWYAQYREKHAGAAPHNG